jgi:hypothetical protein
MLAVSKYQKEYIHDCKTKMRAQLDVYKKLIAECKNKEGKNEPSLYIAIDYFEAEFFNNLVILLDALFVHRLRDKEGKEENPLNEVRILANSMITNKNILLSDKSIKRDPGKSILKLKPGESIKINEEQFSKLSDAFFEEIEKKYL